MDNLIQRKRVILGMSGGVDSAVSASLLLKQGFQVTGITFLFGGPEEQSKQHLNDAKELANNLQINHYVIDMRHEFEEKVIQRFVNEYKEGKTPFPCAFCNPEVKFHHLNRLAGELHCDFISTGHYAGISEYNEVKYVTKGIDRDKDQSFFLWGLKTEIINKLILPLGNYHKSEIREYAKKIGLSRLATKKESMGICFVGSTDYRKYLNDRVLYENNGNFVDQKGKILGQHSGITNYTIGQRRGLGLNLNKPLFVSEIRANKNEIVLSDFKALYRCIIFINRIHFIDNEQINKNKIYIVKIR